MLRCYIAKKHKENLNINTISLKKYIISNNRIRAKQVRLIDESGKQLGVLSLSDALKKALDAGLDLIQVTDKIDPPVCKIMEYGKYAYQQSKKEKKQTHKGGEMKSIRLTFNISPHDMETRVKSAQKFLDQGHKLKIEMRLRGRQKALGNYAREKVQTFLQILGKAQPIKIEKELRREPRGFNMIIGKDNRPTA